MVEMRFTKSHEWVKVEAQIATIGITDYAQKQLGDIVFIEMPEVGIRIKQSAQFGTVESTKAASELYSPLSGEVLEVNGQLIDNPQWINESSLDNGWMIKIRMDNPAELDSLMDEIAYKEFLSEEEA